MLFEISAVVVVVDATIVDLVRVIRAAMMATYEFVPVVFVLVYDAPI